tara:strand:- start:977 stop:1882 length:906 start_codon:yes stop_codon:yes gene_type:complete
MTYSTWSFAPHSMPLHQLHTQHDRSFAANRYVYPVLSRRSGGISVGVNLNQDKVCNFDCIYCQVNRREQSETRFVGIETLLSELREVLAHVHSGNIYKTDQFQDTPAKLRRLNDIAFSGDGEPTTYKNFDSIIAACAEVKKSMGLNEVKMVLITNASMFHRKHVKQGLATLDCNQGEVWAKLDAGTSDYYHLIERTPIPFQRILDNITSAAMKRPLVIQSLWMQVNGEGPSPEELMSYCDRLNDIISAGGALSLVQTYTVARRPAESNVLPLADAKIDAISQLVRDQVGIPAASFYGSTGY